MIAKRGSWSSCHITPPLMTLSQAGILHCLLWWISTVTWFSTLETEIIIPKYFQKISSASWISQHVIGALMKRLWAVHRSSFAQGPCLPPYNEWSIRCHDRATAYLLGYTDALNFVVCTAPWSSAPWCWRCLYPGQENYADEAKISVQLGAYTESHVSYGSDISPSRHSRTVDEA